MRSLITPFITRRWSSDQFQAKKVKVAMKARNANIAQVFIALDDPYSYLLLKGLQRVQQQNHILVHIHLIHNRQAEMFPEPQMWQKWARQDAQHLADLYGYPLPVLTSDSEWILSLAHSFLNSDPTSVDSAMQLFETNHSQLSHLTEEQRLKTETFLESEENVLLDLGHYLPATIYYAGEFFWGLDRISHFESRLFEHNRANQNHNGLIFTKTYDDYCRASKHLVKDKTTPLELYFSMRSPYSHIALNRCYKLCKHYDIPFIIKPVLPMLMRGLPVPKNKTQYIFFDTLRESRKLGIPYGNVADPIGQGVRNCYAIWMLAEEQGKGNEFMLAFSNAVNAQGLSGNYHFGLKKICKQAGLDWPEAKQALERTDWQDVVKQNLETMYEKGMWGVPTIAYGKTWVWGQDRIWKIEQSMLETAPNQSEVNA